MKPGPKLFQPGDSPRTRRRRLIFLAIWLVAAAMVMWPVYPRFAGVEPLILGLPLGFAWVVGAVLLVFAGLLWLFLGEEE